MTKNLLSKPAKYALRGVNVLTRPFGGAPPALQAEYALNAIRLDSAKDAKHRVLWLRRGLLDKDVAQMVESTNLDFLSLRNTELHRCQSTYVPREYRKQTFHVETLADRRSWGKVEDFGLRFVRGALDKYNINFVLDANFDYWQSYSVRHACKELGVPFFVLSKENPTTESAKQFYFRRYKNWQFEGQGIGCPSHHLSQVFEKLGVAGNQELWLTGLPRLDAYRKRHDIEPQKARNVTLLSFRGGNYGLESESGYFDFLATLKTIVAEFRQTTGCRFLVKCKDGRDYRHHLAHFKNQRSYESKKDCELCYEAKLKDVFASSTVVLGLNSLSVVEALLSRATIIMPVYLLSQNNKEHFHFDNFSERYLNELGVYRCYDVDHLTKIIEYAFAEGTFLGQDSADRTAGRIELMNEFLFFDQNRLSSALVEEMMTTASASREL
jgi:hypothetical protein